MVDYNKYFNSVAITRNDAIRVISKRFLKFDKEPMSMCANANQYGVQLCPEAEEILAKAFGYGEGLSVKAPSKKNHGNKRKPHRLYVRVSQELKESLESVYNRLGFQSMQDLIETALWEFCSRRGYEFR